MHHYHKKLFLIAFLMPFTAKTAERSYPVHEVMQVIALTTLSKQQARIIAQDLQEYVLKYNLYLDEQNDDGNTFLHFAVEEGNPNLAEALWHVGANPWIEDGDNRSPIEIAERESLFSLADFLRQPQ